MDRLRRPSTGEDSKKDSLGSELVREKFQKDVAGKLLTGETNKHSCLGNCNCVRWGLDLYERSQNP